jgi:putative ABC transport system permease protein
VARGARRFGADLVVVPRGGGAAAEGALIVGQPTQLRLPLSALDAVRATPGVLAASPQVYVKTLANARCCPGEFFLVGYDPRTDFTIAPWLQAHGRSVGAFEAVIGNRISLPVGDEVPFFGTPFRIAGQLEPTGVGLDLTIFVPLAGLRQMIADSPTRAREPLTINPDEISVVLVKLAPGADAAGVAEDLGERLQGVDVILAPRVIGRALGELGRALALLAPALGLLWLALVPVLGLAFSAAVHERRRDIGLWRALGATRRFVFRLILGEAALLTGFGAALGWLVAVVILVAAGAPVAESAGRPYVWPGWGWLVAHGVLLGLAALLTGAAAAWLPARSAARAEPYECLRRAGG